MLNNSVPSNNYIVILQVGGKVKQDFTYAYRRGSNGEMPSSGKLLELLSLLNPTPQPNPTPPPNKKTKFCYTPAKQFY